MPHNLEEFLVSKKDTAPAEPVIFDFNNEEHERAVTQLFENGKIQVSVDDYEEQQLELFGIQNPTKVYTQTFKEEFKIYYTALASVKPIRKDGNWIYFPWSSKLVHVLKDADFQSVRTARNKNLINEEEQKNFYNTTVGIGGLSIGSSVAFLLTLQGGAKHIKLADMDRLALSNTNRILMGVDNLGVLKVEMAARRMYEINPYMKIELYRDGLSPDNIDDFFTGLDVVVDELDNIAIKYLMREKAQQYKIPVLMGTDNGDNAVIDVERYDHDEPVEYFHGKMGDDLSYESLTKLDKFGIGKMATKCVGVENVTVKMQESLLQMGKTIVSWPQLGGAAIVNGASIAYCIRKIANNQPLVNSRSLINMDELLIPTYNEPDEVTQRQDAAETFRKIFGL